MSPVDVALGIHRARVPKSAPPAAFWNHVFWGGGVIEDYSPLQVGKLWLCIY